MNSLPKNNIVSYADDTAIFTCGKETTDLMNTYLKLLNYWLCINQLSLNVDKFVYMAFTNHNNKLPAICQVKINNCALRYVSSIKYLGLIFDNHLKWKEHIQKIVSRTRYLLFFSENLVK